MTTVPTACPECGTPGMSPNWITFTCDECHQQEEMHLPPVHEAAPELLKACKAMQSLLRDAWDHLPEHCAGGPDAVNDAADALANAIARAEGRQ